MQQAGYGRLTAALLAAVGLHALLFVLLPTWSLPLFGQAPGGLAVELLPSTSAPQPSSPASDVSAMSAQPYSKGQASHHPVGAHAVDKAVSSVSPTSARFLQSDMTLAYEPPETRRMPAEREHEDGKVAESVSIAVATGKVEANSKAVQTASLPDAVRQRILAHVHYPRQARRFGWQGRVEFRLRVAEQGIHDIVLLVSTGHALLDRAARQGIEQAGRVPLVNGSYLLPVEFRLQ